MKLTKRNNRIISYSFKYIAFILLGIRDVPLIKFIDYLTDKIDVIWIIVAILWIGFWEYLIDFIIVSQTKSKKIIDIITWIILPQVVLLIYLTYNILSNNILNYKIMILRLVISLLLIVFVIVLDWRYFFKEESLEDNQFS